MKKQKQIVIAPSETNPRRWFIFRRNGQEISFEINDNFKLRKISHSLSPDEYERIYEEIIPNLKVI